jgi:hypothetical protein
VPADNPIHTLTAPDVEALAAALTAYPWERIVPDRWARVTPCWHRGPGPCGLCAGDAHAIAAAVLDIQAGGL